MAVAVHERRHDRGPAGVDHLGGIARLPWHLPVEDPGHLAPRHQDTDRSLQLRSGSVGQRGAVQQQAQPPGILPSRGQSLISIRLAPLRLLTAPTRRAEPHGPLAAQNPLTVGRPDRGMRLAAAAIGELAPPAYGRAAGTCCGSCALASRAVTGRTGAGKPGGSAGPRAGTRRRWPWPGQGGGGLRCRCGWVELVGALTMNSLRGATSEPISSSKMPAAAACRRC